jgi:sec-independent protein translocase protein TatA
MGTFSIWHILLVLLLAVLLFGRGKISDLMGDVAKGIKSFKKGMAEDEPPGRIAQGQTQGEAHPAKADEGVKH